MPDEETQATTTETTEKPVGSPPDMASMQLELDRARKEAARYRVRARELEEGDGARKETEAKDREESARKSGDLERHLAELKAERETEKKSASTKEAAYKRRLVDEALRARLSDSVDPDILKLIDRKTINVSDDYDIDGIDEAVAAFRAAKPHFFTPPGQASRGTSQGSGPRGTSVQKGPPEFDPTKSIADQLAAFR